MIEHLNHDRKKLDHFAQENSLLFIPQLFFSPFIPIVRPFSQAIVKKATLTELLLRDPPSII